MEAMPDDADLDALVLRHRDGDAAAFAQLIAATQRRVRSCIAARIWITDAVEELTQDTYVEVFEHLERYQGDGRFQVWVLGIARNRCRIWLEQRRREGARSDALTDLAASLDVPAGQEEESLADLERLQRCMD